MKPDYEQLRKSLHRVYQEEHEALDEEATLGLLDAGRCWDLKPVLDKEHAHIYEYDFGQHREAQTQSSS